MGLTVAINVTGVDLSNNNVFAQESILLGDLDSDGKVTLKDASAGLKLALGIPNSGVTNFKGADIFGDSAFSMKSVQIILKSALGMGDVATLVEQMNSPDNSITQKPAATKTPTVIDNNLSYAKQVLKLVNAERTKQGLGTLVWDEPLVAAAMTRAEEITVKFEHRRPDGKSWNSILEERNISWTGCAENIAYGQATPEAVVKAWMNSDGHRANILNGSYTKIGIGCYKNSSGVYYWTQLFVK